MNRILSLFSLLILFFTQDTLQQFTEVHCNAGNKVDPTGSNDIPNTDAVAPDTHEVSALPNQDNNQSGSGGKSTAIKHGELTYYTIGQGACGLDHSGQDGTISIAALSHLLMGRRSNDNPMCGKTVTIKANGRYARAIVQDKCMGCAMEDIDVSEKVFLELWDSLDRGRVEVEWWFDN
jgi:hypothetical protein